MKASRQLGFLLLAGVAYRMLLSLQGIDHIDTGFSCTYFQHFFSHPDVMVYNHMYYLTGLVGGTWNAALGSWGLLGMRLFEAVTIALAVGLLAQTVRPWTDQAWVMAAAGLSLLFPTMVTTFHYNTLSYLLIAACVALYARSLHRRSPWLLAAAGVMIGLAVLARIVNATLCALALVPLLNGWHEGGWRHALRDALTFAAGIAAGVALVVGIVMPLLGHTPYFVQSFTEAFGIVGGDQSSHTGGNIILSYARSLANLLMQMLAVAAMGWIFCRSRRWKRHWHLLTAALLLAAFAALAVTNNLHLTLMAASLVLCLHTLRRGPRFSPCWNVVLMLTLAALLFPLGSDMGIAPAFHWTTGLLVLPAMTAIRLLPSEEKALRRGVAAGIAVLAVCAVAKFAAHCYGEDNLRTCDTALIQPHRLNVFTTPERAADYQRLLQLIEDHRTSPDQALLLGGQASELFYAADMLPYIGMTQMGQYTGDALRERLDQQWAHFPVPPLVLILHHPEHEDDMIRESQHIIRQWAADRGLTVVE